MRNKFCLFSLHQSITSHQFSFSTAKIFDETRVELKNTKGIFFKQFYLKFSLNFFKSEFLYNFIYTING